MNKGVAVSGEVCSMIKIVEKKQKYFPIWKGKMMKIYCQRMFWKVLFFHAAQAGEHPIHFFISNYEWSRKYYDFFCSLDISKCLLWRTAAHRDISKLRGKKNKRWVCLLDFSRFTLSHWSNGKSVWKATNPTIILLCTENQCPLASLIVSHPFIKAGQIN